MFRAITRRFASTVTARPSSFSFPSRLSRSPTAILEALNSCVQLDGGNPAYLYMDDPFLIPTSAHEKRHLSLSKASGKKAARWIIDRYSYAFFHDVANPSIPVYFPNYSFQETELIEPNESTLYKLMNWNKIIQAYDTYKKCLEDKINISDTCKYALFDLLCIYNSDNPMDILLPEEDWYRRDLNETNHSGLIKRTWKENGPAEQMFEELKVSSSGQKTRLYNSLVSGLLKYVHVEKAMIIIDEMKRNNLLLDRTTYNYLLRSTSLIKESYDMRWQFMIDCLNEMRANQIRPDLQTFNAILYTLRRCPVFERGPSLALSVLNEMRKLGIEPSLGTWSHVIMIFYPTDQLGFDTQILPQILDELERQYQANGNKLDWKDSDDGEFFFNAMFKATVNCRDVDLAKRIHQFLMTGSNNRFIPDGFKEQMYYANLLRLLLRVDTPEHVMPLWESIVPNIYSPSNQVMEDLIEFISTWNIRDYFVRLWSDLVMLGFLDNKQNARRLLEHYLTLLNRIDHHQQTIDQAKQYANIARQILKRFPLTNEEDEQIGEKQPSNAAAAASSRPMQPKFQYTGQLLSHLICLLARGNDFEACWSLYEYYTLKKTLLINPLNDTSLMALLSLCVQQKNTDRALIVIETINELKYDCLGDALALLNNNINLTNRDRIRLRTIQKNSPLESAHLVKLV